MKTTAEALSAEQLTAALNEEGRLYGSPGRKAAAHLLTGTELPGFPQFAKHLELSERADPKTGTAVRTARVRDYAALLGDEELYLTGSEAQLVRLAASLDAGTPVDLSEVFGPLDLCQRRRVIEAVTLAADLPK